MSYCVNCGVELAQGEKKCPLCQTTVYNPAEEVKKAPPRPYPNRFEVISKSIDRRYLASLAGIIMLIPFGISLITDLLSDGVLNWSGYVTASLALLFVVAVCPFCMRRYRPVVCAGMDAAAIVVFLFALWLMIGGDWYLTLGLPISAVSGLYLVGGAAIIWKLKESSGLVKAALLFFITGLMVLVFNLLISLYGGALEISWALYVLLPCAVIGAGLLILDHRANLKEQIRKRLFF